MSDTPKRWTWEDFDKSNICWEGQEILAAEMIFHNLNPFINWQEQRIKEQETKIGVIKMLNDRQEQQIKNGLIREKHLKLHLNFQVETIEILREALEFYADIDNWIDEKHNGYPILISKEQLNSGMIARTALREAFGDSDD